MTEKTLKSIVTTLVVLLVLWGASFGLGSMRPGGPSGSDGVSRGLRDLGPETVTGITIQGPKGDKTELKATADVWEANGYPADRDAIMRVWGALAEVKIGDVVASNPANHDRMGVSVDSAWTVVFQTDTGDRTILIGKSARSFSTAYVRLPGDDEVVLTTGDLRASLARPERDWRDKTIAAVDTTRIARFIVRREDGETITIQRGESGWRVGEEPMRQTAIGDLMREVSKITASGFVPEGAELFENNERVLRVEGVDGAVLVQIRFLGNGTTQQARASDQSIIYEIPNWRVDRLTPTAAMAAEPTPRG